MDANVLNLLSSLVRRTKLCRLVLPLQVVDAVSYLSEELVTDSRLMYVTPEELLNGNRRVHKLHVTLMRLKTDRRR